MAKSLLRPPPWGKYEPDATPWVSPWCWPAAWACLTGLFFSYRCNFHYAYFVSTFSILSYEVTGNMYRPLLVQLCRYLSILCRPRPAEIKH